MMKACYADETERAAGRVRSHGCKTETGQGRDVPGSKCARTDGDDPAPYLSERFGKKNLRKIRRKGRFPS